jgi:superfamily II DNA or RNA helicase
MSIQLRPYQQRAIDDLRAAYQRGRRAPLLVAPTGSGKTTVAAWIIKSALDLGNTSLFCAGRVELVNQTAATLRRAGVPSIRVIQANRDEGPPDAPVTVASIDTLRACSELPQAKLLVLDEAHHGAARTWAGIWAGVRNSSPGARLLGLTATPERGDGRALELFDELVTGPTVAELTALGSLAPLRIWAPPSWLEAGKLALDPLTAYQQHAAGQRVVVFCGTVAHAREVLAQFTAAGISADIVTGTTPSKRRAAALLRFTAGELTALINCGVLTEGWDDPEIAFGIVARRIGHAGLWLQIAGRLLRAAPGKRHATLLDLAGNVHEHGPPDLPRSYSLTGRGIRPAAVRDAIRQCTGCGSVALAGPPSCPYCGTEYPLQQRAQPRITGAELRDVTGQAPAPRREYVVTIASKYRGTCAECGRGYARGDRIFWATLSKKAKHVDCRRSVAA